jgi:hypothetical protein
MVRYCLLAALTLIKQVASSDNGNAIGHPLGSQGITRLRPAPAAFQGIGNQDGAPGPRVAPLQSTTPMPVGVAANSPVMLDEPQWVIMPRSVRPLQQRCRLTQPAMTLNA